MFNILVDLSMIHQHNNRRFAGGCLVRPTLRQNMSRRKIPKKDTATWNLHGYNITTIRQEESNHRSSRMSGRYYSGMEGCAGTNLGSSDSFNVRNNVSIILVDCCHWVIFGSFVIPEDVIWYRKRSIR